GLTPMLALSAGGVGIGIVLFVYWRPIHMRLRRPSVLDRHDAEHLYDRLLRHVDAVAAGVARHVQHGDLRRYIQVVLLSTAAMVAWGMFAADVAPRLPRLTEPGGLRIGPAAIALVGLAAGIAAARARTLLTAMIAVGLAGFVT